MFVFLFVFVFVFAMLVVTVVVGSRIFRLSWNVGRHVVVAADVEHSTR